MSTKSEGDYATGVYRCKDSIKNLKIRIRLQQETSAFIPLPELQEIQPDGEKTVENGIESAEAEERIFSWQEKVFSLYEVSQYQHIANCHTALEEKYHQTITELCHDGIPNNRLFTFTSADDFTDSEEANLNVTTDVKSVVTPLVKGFSELRLKQKYAIHRKTRSKQAQNLRRDIVDYSPTDETRKKNHLMDSFPQVMYILADLSIKEAETDAAWFGKSEYVLCVIRYDAAARVLSVTPDFCEGDGAADSYRMEVDGDVRNAYRYWIHHASADIAAEDRDREAEVASKLYAHRSEIRRLQVGSDFEVVRGGALHVTLLGEIVAARGFEYDGLRVRYEIVLPPGWTCQEPTQLGGVTQRGGRRGRRGDTAFAHLFQVELTLAIGDKDREEERAPAWPRLLLSVSSSDHWSRTRPEGNGVVDVPPFPGRHSFRAATWRPAAATHVGEMRRFFVGGGADQLDELAYIAVPQGFEGSRLSKYGLRTQASGSVSVLLNVVHQSQPFVGAGDQSRAGGRQAAFVLERLSAGSLVNSVNNVLKAFKHARDRMLAAKEGLDVKDSE